MARREDTFIETIRSIFAPADVIVGIGDDAAVFHADGMVVITTDVLVEGVDFFDDAPLQYTGHKALAANLSDLAAMGARPTSFLLTIATPPDRLDSLAPLLEGIAALARRHGIALIGGDLSSSPTLSISITAMGKPVFEPLMRSAAKAGDRIFVSRPLGAASAGLELYRRGWRLKDGLAAAEPPPAAPMVSPALRELCAAILRHHLAPEPEIELGIALGAISKVDSCIDLSDGLSTDLRRMCDASGVGAQIDWEKIPIFQGLEEAAHTLDLKLEDLTLHGGEEFALLFTSPLTEYELSHLLGRSVYAIGRIETAEGVRLNRQDWQVPLGDYGWDHFDRSARPQG